jgi:hypothetical protein
LADEYGSPLETFRETGLLVPIAGGDLGYNEQADVQFLTVDGYNLDDLWDEFQDTVSLLNSMRNPLIERLTFPVTRPLEKVPQLIDDEFEEADEFGQPKGIRLEAPWTLGFNLKYYDLGIRYTFRFLGESTASEVRALNASALEADQRLQFKTILNRVFRNTADVATLRGGTQVTAYPFYNGATETLPVAPPSWKTYTHTTSHNHYLTSGAATVTSGDLDEMIDHLHHHGYTEGADIILLANRQEVNTIVGFTRAGGARHDFIPKRGISFLGTLVGEQPGDRSGLSAFPGFKGSYGDILVIEEDYMPALYMVMLASGGRRAERNPVGLREHENAGLRGLKLIPQFDRYPLRESFYHHALGTGIRHRGAGVVMKVTTGSYDVPTITGGGPGGR